jgi:hypothetical protein
MSGTQRNCYLIQNLNKRVYSDDLQYIICTKSDAASISHARAIVESNLAMGPPQAAAVPSDVLTTA